jgi:hypothetical protein
MDLASERGLGSLEIEESRERRERRETKLGMCSAVKLFLHRQRRRRLLCSGIEKDRAFVRMRIL